MTHDEALNVWRKADIAYGEAYHDEAMDAAATVIRDAFEAKLAKVAAERDALWEAWVKLLPIRVHDGPDYAEVFFGDGKTHGTQAMTMNPQDWRDLAAHLGATHEG